MTLRDARDLPVGTRSAAARDAYVDGVERMLGALPGSEAALARAIELDPGFALAHAALARALQAQSRGAEARERIGRAVALIDGLGERERGHVLALERVVCGDADAALAAIRAHLAGHPRDRVVMAPCAGVFGLFGFSGRAGRERALDAFLAQYEAACGDDPWFLAARAFARCEVGELDAARAGVERSLGLWPRNANAAHVRAHVDYECGDDAAGRAWLRDWCAGYPREGPMHCHLHWHLALSALESGEPDDAWAVYDACVAPGAAWGPPLNLLTDASSFLLRAELLGAPREAGRWQGLAAYARERFAQTGVAFADAHAALAFAMAGDDASLARVRDRACGPAADVVAAMATGFGAWAAGDDRAVLRALEPVMDTHERIGGSRAQRDLLEHLVRVAARRVGERGRAPPRVRPLPAPLRDG